MIKKTNVKGKEGISAFARLWVGTSTFAHCKQISGPWQQERYTGIREAQREMVMRFIYDILHAHYSYSILLCATNFSPRCDPWVVQRGITHFVCLHVANAFSARGLGQQSLLIDSRSQVVTCDPAVLGSMVRFDPGKQGMLAAIAPEQHGDPKQTQY